MNTQQLVYTPYTETGEEHKSLREVFTKYAYHWPLFLLCLIFTLTLAFVYIKINKPVYQVKAKISIKDDKNKTTTDKAALLQELNLSTSPKLAESEVEILKSRPLIRQVVNGLQLWVTYSDRNTFPRKDISAESPVRFEMIRQTGYLKGLGFDLNFRNGGQFTMTFDNGRTLDASFDDTFKNRFGKWRLEPTGRLKDYAGKTIRVNIKNQDKTVTEYQNRIGTMLNKTAPIIELKIEDEVPERGTKILNHLIAAYKRFNIMDKNKETENTLKFIDERLISLTGELTDVEKDVEGYKSSVGLTDISSKSQFYLDNVQSIDGRLNEVNVQLQVVEGVERYVRSDGGENAPATIGITDPGLVNLVDQLSKLQLQRDRLLAITPENNPIFVPINRQISSTKEAIKATVGGIKASLLATKRQLQSVNSRFEAGIKDIPGQERQYVSIKRQQGIKESLYVYLLQKREEVGLSYASTLTDARTVEDAYYEEPESNRKLPFAVALLFGMLIPAGIITGRESFRNRVLTRNDIETGTSAPVICELVQDSGKATIVVLNRSPYAIGEQLRALRTNLLHATEYQGKGRVVLFTSSIAGEGKSYVASNIGASLAVSGRKTLIMELDLRRPKISSIFNLDSGLPGLTDFLNGNASKEDIILPSGVHPDLFVVRSGPVPSNPSELLQSSRMENLIKELRFEFDNVLIDSPPLHLVTDAMILAPLCDVSLYMVRHNFTPRSELKFIEEVYQKRKLPDMNLVFNGINMDSRYGYSVDYGYYSNKPSASLWQTVFADFFKRF